MKARAPWAPRTLSSWERPPARFSASSRGFTLLEMVVVLVILGILMAVIAPGMQSAFAEQKLRSDAHELSLMVKTGMIRCEEDHRPYVLELSPTGLSLAPQKAAKPDETTFPASPAADSSTENEGATATEDWHLTAQNQLLLPDAKSAGNWQSIESAQWIFRPGELCPATDVLFKRGDSQLRLSFNALTGNVEKEWSFFP